MPSPVQSIERLARDAARHPEPDRALRALTALRSELDALEPQLVARALEAGASWSRVAAALNVSKQAAHRKHREVVARAAPPPPPAGPPDTALKVSAATRRCVQLAREEAARLGQPAVGTEHLLLGILRCRRSAGAGALAALGVTLARAREELQPTLADVPASELRSLSAGAQRSARRPDLTPHTQRILEGAVREALQLRDGHIAVEHLLMALLTDKRNGAVQTLAGLQVTPDEVRHELERSRADLRAARAVATLVGSVTPAAR